MPCLLRVMFIFLVLVVVACNTDSSNNVDVSAAKQSAYASFEELNALLPCDCSKENEFAHVNANNLDYICSYDCRQNNWSWMVYSSMNLMQECVGDNIAVSSVTFYSSSSSVNPVYYSSSTPLQNLSSSSLNEEKVKSSSSIRENWMYLNPNYAYGEIVDKRDNQIYKTTSIGSQTWLAENLRYVPRNSSALTCWPDASDGMRVKYGNVCDRNGYFYSWAEAIDSLGEFSGNGRKCARLSNAGLCPMYDYPIRGVCPEGWHLPQKAEYEKLLDFVKKSVLGSDPKCSLVSLDVWSYQARCGVRSDKFGFSMLPAGVIEKNKYSNGDETISGLWTSSPDVKVSDDPYDKLSFTTDLFYDPVGQAYSIKTYDEPKLELYRDSIYMGKIPTRYPVRCVKD